MTEQRRKKEGLVGEEDEAEQRRDGVDGNGQRNADVKAEGKGV